LMLDYKRRDTQGQHADFGMASGARFATGTCGQQWMDSLQWAMVPESTVLPSPDMKVL